MPFVNIRTAKGALTSEQKKELQQRITELMVEVEGRGNEAFRQFVWVMIEEEELENWSIGGNQVSRKMVDTIQEKSF